MPQTKAAQQRRGWATPRWGMIAAALVVFALIACQVLLPSLAERGIEDRLTEGGGSADVTLGAVPALRLLWSDGERFEIAARELELDLDEDQDVFEKLDGFGVVEIAIDEFRAGPFQLATFALRRDAPDPYTLTAVGETSPAALIDYGLSNLGIPGGAFAELALETMLGDSEVQIPIELEMELTSEDGEIQSEGDATVAGLPAGPIAEVIAAAIVARL